VPTVVLAINTLIEVPSANLTLSTFAPTVVWTDNRSSEIPSANLSLSTFVPDRVAVTLIEIPSANLSLSTFTPTLAVSVPVQILRSDSDITDGGWTTDTGGNDLFTAIDEVTPSDLDYIRSEENPANDVAEVGLTNQAGGIVAPYKVRYRYMKTPGVQIDLVVDLVQGITVIATWTHTDISDSIVQVEQTLTAPEAANVTNVNDLRVRFTANAP